MFAETKKQLGKKKQKVKAGQSCLPVLPPWSPISRLGSKTCAAAQCCSLGHCTLHLKFPLPHWRQGLCKNLTACPAPLTPFLMHGSWEGLNISVSFHLKYSCRFLIRAFNKQRRCCLQTIPFTFYLDSTACWERGFEGFTRALWLPRQYRSIKLVDTYLIILPLTQEAPIYPGHQRIPLSRSNWGRRGHLPTLPA